MASPEPVRETGAEVARAEQRITAKLADTRIAPLLDVGIGAPFLGICRLVTGEDGRPLEYLEALYRPDVYEDKMTMIRKGKKSRLVWSDASQTLR